MYLDSIVGKCTANLDPNNMIFEGKKYHIPRFFQETGQSSRILTEIRLADGDEVGENPLKCQGYQKEARKNGGGREG